MELILWNESTCVKCGEKATLEFRLNSGVKDGRQYAIKNSPGYKCSVCEFAFWELHSSIDVARLVEEPLRVVNAVRLEFERRDEGEKLVLVNARAVLEED